jgi:hypothetical protein
VEKDIPVVHNFFCPVKSREDMKEKRFNILFSDTIEAEKQVGPSKIPSIAAILFSLLMIYL